MCQKSVHKKAFRKPRHILHVFSWYIGSCETFTQKYSYEKSKFVQVVYSEMHSAMLVSVQCFYSLWYVATRETTVVSVLNFNAWLNLSPLSGKSHENAFVGL